MNLSRIPNDLFISYQWDNQQDVIKLKEFLKRNNFQVWMDIAGLSAGDTLTEKLSQAILNSKIIICCITKKYAESTMCRKEIHFAINEKKPIIPLMFEYVKMSELDGGVGFLISDILRINLFKDKNVLTNWLGPLSEELLSAVRDSLKNYLTSFIVIKSKIE